LETLFEHPIIATVESVAHRLQVPAYIVGGAVRDYFLKRKIKDIDILVVGEGVDFAKEVAREYKAESNLTVFKTFGTAHLGLGDIDIEFVGARKESYVEDSRKPDVVAGTLDDDLSRRDFTINALAVSLNREDRGEIVDLFHGLADLNDKVLKTPLDPDITFSDDPLRMMRGIRFASQLLYRLEYHTYEAIKHNKDRLLIVSQERITDELNKIILSPVPSIGFIMLEECGLLDLILPELVTLKGVSTVDNKSHKDNFYHTLQVLDNVAKMSDNLWLRWAAILHDIGKPASQRFDPKEGFTFHGHEVIGARMTPQIFKKLKLPLNDHMKYVQKMVLLHLRPIALTHEVTDSAVRRLIMDTGDDIEELLQLCKADVTSKNPEKVKRYLKRFDEVWEKICEVEEKDRLRNWNPPITGEIIMDTFGIKPSREVGTIKDAIREAILNGDIHNEYNEAYGLMIKLGTDLGLVAIKNA